MSNLTSTVPGAFNALYGLLTAAGAAQQPPIPVFHSEVLQGQQTQNGYVLLTGVRRHKFEPAALGSFAFYEDYEIFGETVYYQGGPDPVTMVENVLTTTWGIYQNVVMTPVVENRGQPAGSPVLGSSAPGALEWVVPLDADYVGRVGSVGGSESGFSGCVSFCFCVHARLTTA